MKRPKISIIIPTLNNENSVALTLGSVINQSYKNLEIVVLDGSSTDTTVSIVKKYKKNDPRIKLSVEKDEGIYDAMNKGIDISTGDWLYFMGADDELYNENVINDLYNMKVFEQKKIFYGNVIIHGDNPWAKDQTKYDGPFDLSKILYKNICQQAIFYPRGIVDKIGYFNKNYHITADYDYNLRCYASQDFFYIDKIIANFKSGGKSSQHIIDVGFKDYTRNIINYFKLDTESEIKKSNSPFLKLLNYYKYLQKTLLNPFNESINEGISLITAVRNSNELSEDALKTWIEHAQIDEIIIVDWNSDNTILPLIEKYQNGKIILARVESKEEWNYTHAYNLAARLTSRDKILKIGGDVQVLPGFLESHQLKSGVFYSGSIENVITFNGIHLIDHVFFYRSDFFRVNGYHDFFSSYRWEDIDLFSRLISDGLECHNLKTEEFSFKIKKTHPDIKNYPEVFQFISGEEWRHIQFLMNKHVQNSEYDWFYRSIMPDFDIETEKNNILKCKLSENFEPKSASLNLQDFEVEAIKERLHEIGSNLPDKLINHLTKEEIVHFYNLYLNKDIFNSSEFLFSLIQKFRNTYYTSVKEKDEKISKQTGYIQQKDQVLLQKNEILHDLEQTLDKKEKQILSKNQVIEQNEQIILEKDRVIENKTKQILEKDLYIEQKDIQISRLNQNITQLDQKLADKDEIIMHSQSTINNHRAQIKLLNIQLIDIYNSYSWKIGKSITNIIAKVFFFLPLRKQQGD